jgi:hypothetical protein
MPITILSGCAMGYLGCLIIGRLFFDNADKLLIWNKEGGWIGIFGLVLCVGGALVGAVAPWIVLYFFNPDAKSRRRSGRESTPIIQV